MFGIKSIAGLLFLLFFSYLVHFLGLFYTTPEYQELYSNCHYLDTDLALHGSEDSVFYSKDILIGIHANMHKIFLGKLPLEQVEKGGFLAVYGISTGKFVTKKVEVRNYPSEIYLIPHGIYLRGSDLLYIINHSFTSGGERVETFKIVENEVGEVVLEYLHYTQMEPKFNGITNDLVVLSDERYIITDWQVFTIPMRGNRDKPVWQYIATMVAWVLKFKTTNAWDCKYVKGGVAQCFKVKNSTGVMVNGISYDGKDTIAVSDTIDRVVKMYKINNNNAEKELELFQTLPIDIMCDNLSYDAHNQQFIIGGTNTVFEYLTLNKKLHQVQDNKSNQSVVDYQGRIETIKLNPTTKKYENKLLFTSSSTVVGLAGAQIDESQKYLFINSFPDKSLVVCTKTNL